MRRCTLAVGRVASSRGNVTISIANPILHAVAIERQYTNPLWVSSTTLSRRGGAPIPGEEPVLLDAPRRIELFNMSDMRNCPAEFATMRETPRNVQNKEPYKAESMRNLLNGAVIAHRFTSNWWVTRKGIKTHGFQPRYSAVKVVGITPFQMEFWNVDQVTNGEELANTPWHGGSGDRFSSPELRKMLQQRMQERGDHYGIFFTPAEVIKAGGAALQGMLPVDVEVPNEAPAKFVNIDDIVGDSTALLKQFNRPVVSTPHDLITGEELSDAEITAHGVDRERPRQYWVTRSAMQYRGWEAVAHKKQSFYHLDQLDDSIVPKIGTLV